MRAGASAAGGGSRCRPCLCRHLLARRHRLTSPRQTRAPGSALPQEAGKRPEGSPANINSSVVKAFEGHSFKQLLDAPPSALQGLAAWWVRAAGSRVGGMAGSETVFVRPCAARAGAAFQPRPIKSAAPGGVQKFRTSYHPLRSLAHVPRALRHTRN